MLMSNPASSDIEQNSQFTKSFLMRMVAFCSSTLLVLGEDETVRLQLLENM